MIQPAVPQAPNVVGEDWIVPTADGVSLLMSRCAVCESMWFPPLSTCAKCNGSDTSVVHSPSDGQVYAATRVRVAAPGFVAPYTLAYVDIGGVRLLVHAPGGSVPDPGTAIRLELGDLPTKTPTRSYVAVVTTSRSDV